MEITTYKHILWAHFIFFAVFVLEVVFAQSVHEKGNETIDFQSVMATMTFLLFSAAFLACIWCACCMGDLYEINSGQQNKRQSISEDQV